MVQDMKPMILNDWVTTPQNPLHSILTAGNDILPHYHLFYEIVYIIDGSIRHSVNGMERMLHPGDMVFLNLTDCHCFYRTQDTVCCHRDIFIRPEFFESVCDFIGQDFKQAYMMNRLSKVISLPFEQSEHFERMLSNASLLLDSNSAFKDAHIRMLCVSLLNFLTMKEIQTDIDYYPVWLRELLSRFHMNDYLQAGLDLILEPFHFSRPYMCRAFQRYLGCTMTEYLNDIRLQQAAYRLLYTDDTVLSICNTVGISSVSYFNTIFKKKYGASPQNFRKTRGLLDTSSEGNGSS